MRFREFSLSFKVSLFFIFWGVFFWQFF
jgi:hypothetical protein